MRTAKILILNPYKNYIRIKEVNLINKQWFKNHKQGISKQKPAIWEKQ